MVKVFEVFPIHFYTSQAQDPTIGNAKETNI